MSRSMKFLALVALAWGVLHGAVLAQGQAPAQGQTPPGQETQARFAFVVGNDAYEGAPLATAANDAAVVADALKAARFDVTGARNLDQDTLRASYREFLAKVAGAGANAVSVVYVSGYGMQFDGENYIVPPGASIARDADISLNAIRLSDLIRPLSGAPGRGRVVLLDLAYDGPVAKAVQGLAPGLALMEPEAGTIVGFNAAPGVWAAPGKEPYGPYAQALSEMLREPGLPIEEILTRVRTRVAELTKSAQTPWNAGRIEPALVLLERAADAPAPAVAPDRIAAERAKPVGELPEALAYSAAIDRDTIKGYEDFVAAYPQSPYTKNVRGLLAARREARTWRRTLDINTQNAYWSYLKRYPRGPHAADARRRLARLQAALEPPPAFDQIAYDDAPPPPPEEEFFAGPDVSYYDPGVPPIGPSIFVAAPPPWYQPPPPPVFDEDDDFFLPEVSVVSAPAWIAAPQYVLPPPDPYRMETRPPGWRPFVAIPAALAVGLAAGRLSNRFLENRRQTLGQPPRPRRPPVLPAISSLPKGMNLPAGVRPGQPFVRPVNRPVGQPPLVRPGQMGQPGAGAVLPGQPPHVGRPNNALPNLPGQRPGQLGQPGAAGIGTPMTQPGLRPGQPTLGGQIGQPGRPGQMGQPGRPGQPGLPAAGSATPLHQPGSRGPGAQPGQLGGQPSPGQPGAGQPLDRRQQMIQQRQQQQQQRALQQQQRQQQLQQQQQQRAQQQQQRQQQMQQRQQQLQEQRARQQQLQQQKAQQSQQQQQRQQQMQLNQQRQQQLQQQRQQVEQRRMQQQQQQQRQQQLQQQRAIQQQQMQQQRVMQQQRQQQMMQQQRQQQQIMQQQRQQQIMQQQRQQQMMQQQRQQQLLQQQQMRRR